MGLRRTIRVIQRCDQGPVGGHGMTHPSGPRNALLLAVSEALVLAACWLWPTRNDDELEIVEDLLRASHA